MMMKKSQKQEKTNQKFKNVKLLVQYNFSKHIDFFYTIFYSIDDKALRRAFHAQITMMYQSTK
jgi:hypothetical protein